MKGTILNITKDKKKVLLNVQDPEHWYDLAEWIKADYVKRGDCDYKLDKDNPKLITFIKCTGSGYNAQNYPTQNNPQQEQTNFAQPPVDMTKPTQFVPESEVTALPPKENYWDIKGKRDIQVQKSIQNQFFLREALKSIEIHNSLNDDKIQINTLSIVKFANMLKEAFEMLD